MSAPPTLHDRMRALKARFDAAHAAGMAALQAGDYDEFDAAIVEERAIIDEQAEVIAAARRALAHGE